MRPALALAALCLLPAPGVSRAQGSFDGSWHVTVTCGPTPGGAAGYVLRFPAQVTNGVLVGEYSNHREGSELRLEGNIRADGTALIRANGITGSPTNTVGRVARGTPYRYTAEARFTAQSGEGQRRETRPCTLVFQRA
jgi:hypothetical protein